ncbi:MAG: DUF2147 domain-containing protein [Flavobacteriales bacterium]|nr:DUF2147 domain-containing protein [Flavobacteriales bacterium]
MKKINARLLIFLTFFILVSFINPSYYSENDVLGIYLAPNKKSKIKFVKKDGVYYGILVWNMNSEIKDKFNTNEKLRNKNLIGQAIFKSFKYNKYEHSWTGYFYDAESGTTYDCELWLENAKKHLMTRGYINTPIIGRTEMLKRILN